MTGPGKKVVGLAAPAEASGWLKTLMMLFVFVFLASNYFSIAVNSIALGLIAICWVAVMLVERRASVSSTPLDYFVLAYVVAELLATVFSWNPAQSLLFSKRLLLIGIVYLFASITATELQAKRFVSVLLGSATVVALIGVGKVLFGEHGENARLGIFQFYMTTSELMTISALLVLPFVVHARTPRPVRWLALAALIPILISLYATVTRGAYLAATVGAIFTALVRNKRILIPLVILLLLVVVFAPPYVENRIKSITDINHPDNASRLMMWGLGMKIFADHPIVGVGDIDLHELLVQYAGPDQFIEHGHLHNTFMQFLVTIGSLGFIAIVALFIRMFVVEWRIYKAVKDDWFAGSFSLGALAVFVGFQVTGLSEWSFGDQEVVIMVWTTLGLTLGIGKLYSQQAVASS